MKKATIKGLLAGTMMLGGLLIGQRAFADSSIPMYRVYNPYSGEHLYTRTTAERDSLTRIDWRYEGVAWQTPTSGTPVYRLYNRYNGEHFYTIDAGERDKISHTGWTYEGVAFYSYTGGGGVPVTRLYNRSVN